MTPKLLHWDAHHATAAERDLARQANARSGLAALALAARVLPPSATPGPP
jgi:alkane 1-monooxygenase